MQSQPEPEKTPFNFADELGNLLIITAAAMLVALAILVAVSQGDGDPEPREPEPHFVDEYDDDEPRTPRGTDCVPDYSDAEERFAPECDGDSRREGDGLFAD